MNANQLRSRTQTVQPANRNHQRPLALGAILALALVLLLNAGDVAAQKSSTPLDSSRPAAPGRMNDRLYVPCSVSGCTASPSPINSHLYVPCSVSGCVAPSVINNHLYVPCGVGRCNRNH